MIRVLHINYITNKTSAVNHIVDLQKRSGKLDVRLLTMSMNMDRTHLKLTLPFDRRLDLWISKILNRLVYNRSGIYFSATLGFSKALPLRALVWPDILHIHWTGLGSFRLQDFDSFNGPIVFHLHDSFHFTGGCHTINECFKFKESCHSCEYSPIRKASSRHLLEKYSFYKKHNINIISPSSTLLNLAKSSSLFKDSLGHSAVIPNILLSPKKSPKSKKSKDVTITLIASRIDDVNKQIYKFCEEMDVKELMGLQIILIGDFKKKVELEYLNVKYLGYLSDSKMVQKIIEKSHFTAVVSRFESFSMVALESILMSTPVITFSNLGATDFIVNEKNGLIFSPNDWRGIQKRLIRIYKGLENYQSIYKSTKLYDFSNNIKDIVKSYEDYYLKVLQ